MQKKVSIYPDLQEDLSAFTNSQEETPLEKEQIRKKRSGINSNCKGNERKVLVLRMEIQISLIIMRSFHEVRKPHRKSLVAEHVKYHFSKIQIISFKCFTRKCSTKTLLFKDLCMG